MPQAAPTTLPAGCMPRGLSRVQAAEYVGVGVTKFDEMVRDRRMPSPKRIDELRIWDRFQLQYSVAENIQLYSMTRPQGAGTVYIIGFDNYIKIGFTTNLKNRLSSIQTYAPQKLRLYVSFAGSVSDEKRLHQRFSAYRQNGEWFELSQELQTFIDVAKGDL